MLARTLIALIFASCAYSAYAETLSQAISRAVQYLPEIRAAQARREAASAQTGEARAEYFPSVDAAVGEGRERSRNLSTRSTDVSLLRHEADINVSQLLFDGGAAGGQVRRFTARTEGAAFTVTDAAENAGLRAGQAYIDVQRLREQLAIAQENVKIHLRTLDDVNALADAGRGRRADVTQADARRALAVSAVEQLVGQLGQSESTFKYLTGRLPADLDPVPVLASKLPPSITEAVRVAVDTHPAVRSAEKEFQAAEFDRDSVRARYMVPRVTLEGGGSRNRNLDGLVGPNNDLYAMLRLRYNLFRGFADSERLRESEARINEAIAGLARTRNEVERDVRQAWDTLASDRTRLPQLAQYARASADVAEAYRMQFQLGQRSLLDVLNAENERFNATASFIAGRAAVTAGELRLLATVGRLLDAVDVAPPQQPQKSSR